MRGFLCAIALLYCCGLQAQSDSIVRSYYANGNTYEEYVVSKADAARNGYYKRYTLGGKILVEGTYNSNNRTGIWIWYANKEARVRDTVEIYDYSTGKSVYYNNPSYTGPRYPGGMEEFTKDVAARLVIPEHLIAKYAGRKVVPMFKLNCDGSISNIKFQINSEYPVIDKELEAIVTAALLGKYPLWIACADEIALMEKPLFYNLPIVVRLK